MKRYIFLSFSLLCLVVFSGCGHNVLTDYEVNGFDLSIPIFGYPFGVRIGCVKVNANMVRGNSSYSSHSNISTGVASGNAQKTSVIQFSSNTQVNEGNIENIIRDEKVDSEVKNLFVKNYLGKQNAPEILPVSTKTPTTTTASSNSTKVHSIKIEPQKQKSLLQAISPFSWLNNILIGVGDYFLMSTSGQIILLLIKIIAFLITFFFIRDVIKKIISGIRKLFTKKK